MKWLSKLGCLSPTLIPGTNVVRETQLPQTVLCPPHGCSNTPNTHTRIINNH